MATANKVQSNRFENCCENIGVTDGSNDLNPIGYDGNRKNKEDENKTQPHVFVFQVTM